MTLNPIETLKASIYSPKHTNKTNKYLECSNFSKNQKYMMFKNCKFEKVSGLC